MISESSVGSTLSPERKTVIGIEEHAWPSSCLARQSTNYAPAIPAKEWRDMVRRNMEAGFPQDSHAMYEDLRNRNYEEGT